jgi:hypothetical protein
MPTVVDLWRRGQRGWPAAYPLVQFPNVPLGVGLVGSVVARVVEDGAVHDVARVVAVAGLAAWAALELAQGVNAFRRVLGAGFLVYLAVGAATG